MNPARANGRHTLERTTFATSRLLDFCSEKELIAQTGHETGEWPLVVLKELMDNAIDACEDAGTAPAVSVKVSGEGIEVCDYGPGIPPETVARVLDFNVRVSSREAYVSPTRGAQGNALKTLVAMPFVLDGSQGVVEVAARGIRHTITMRLDRIRQRPDIEHRQEEDHSPTNGTSVRVHWPDAARSGTPTRQDTIVEVDDEESPAWAWRAGCAITGVLDGGNAVGDLASSSLAAAQARLYNWPTTTPSSTLTSRLRWTGSGSKPRSRRATRRGRSGWPAAPPRPCGTSTNTSRG
jgi:hypothetical protein